MGVVEKFLANIAISESDFDFAGVDLYIFTALFAEKSRLDVAEVFCVARCRDFNLSDDREIAQRLRGSRFLEIGQDFGG